MFSKQTRFMKPNKYKKVLATGSLLICLFFVSINDKVFAQGKTPQCENGVDKTNCVITQRIVEAINIMSILVGIIVVAMIIWGGIQYTMSRDNPQQTAAAKSHIVNAVFALIFYIFSVAFLNWLIPGGVFN